MDRAARRIIWCLFAATLAQRASPAQADDRALSDAKEHFQAGARAYKLGNYEKAVDEYKQSYALSSAPLLLYNLGQAYWKLGQFDLALHSYQQFLTDAPASSSHRSEAEQHAQELRRLLENKAAWPTAPAPAPTPLLQSITITTPAPRLAPSRRTSELATGIGLSALTLACAVASIPLVLNGNDLHQQAAQATTIDSRTQLANQASAYHSAGWAMLGIAGAAAIGSAIAWGFFGVERRRLSVVPQSGGAAGSLRGTW